MARASPTSTTSWAFRFFVSVSGHFSFQLSPAMSTCRLQLRRTCKRHVLIAGDSWKLKWPETETKNRKAHEVVLVGEARAIVERAWANRLPDCDLLFHVN